MARKVTIRVRVKVQCGLVLTTGKNEFKQSLNLLCHVSFPD
jgi:hypothetical protein